MRSILICSTAYGGCGTVKSAEEFGGERDFVFCPVCNEDSVFQLTDENFDSLTNEHNRIMARQMIDKYHASVHGSHLRFCVDQGFISKERLTPEQREELVEL